MKTALLFSFFLFASFWVNGQTPDTALVRVEIDSLLKLANRLKNEKLFDKGWEIVEEAEQKVLSNFGGTHELYAQCMDAYGHNMWRRGDSEKAEEYFLKSTSTRKNVYGEKSLMYASSLISFAHWYVYFSEYDKASTIVIESKNIIEKKIGKENKGYIQCLNFLAIIHLKKAEYEVASLLFKEILLVDDKIKTEQDYFINNLAVLYTKMGLYDLAESYFLFVKSTREIKYGILHPNTALVYNNLGGLFKEMGLINNAEMHYLMAKTIHEKIDNKQHPDYAEVLKSLAKLYSFKQAHDKAEPYILEAIKIIEKSLGTNHEKYAHALLILANLQQSKGSFQKAEQILGSALSVIENKFGKVHPDYATALIEMGNLNFKKKQFEKAESFYLEAKEILDNSLGEDHKDIVNCLQLLNTLYFKLELWGQAELFSLNIFNILANRIEHSFGFLSDYEKEKYLEQNINPIITQIQSQALHIQSLEFQDLQYEVAFLMKGIQLQASKETLHYILSQQDVVAIDAYNKLLGVQRRLSKQFELPFSKRDQVTKLESEKESLEKKLARASAKFRKEQAASKITTDDLKQALKINQAAIEFVKFSYRNPSPTDSIMYAAVLLNPNEEHARFIPLFEEKSLDSLISSDKERRADYVNDLYTTKERGITVDGKASESLYDLIWKPLEKELQGVKTIYFSPSGLLHRINLGAIAVNDEQNISDLYQLNRLNSTRQLVIPDEVKISTNDAVLYGGIQYEMDSTALVNANMTYNSDDVTSRGSLSFTYLDSTLRGGHWDYLKWTMKEVNDIAEVMKSNGIKTSLRTDHSGTEESFRAIGQLETSPRILHLATHGFFFPDPKSKAVDAFDNINEPVFKMSEHPMIRAGLIMAGGNRVWQNKPALKGMEDGILTAYEISQMNLSNTELVVLSACETGLGDIKGNEGVYGLQRAFKMAGAKYLIMSLWQVPDRRPRISW